MTKSLFDSILAADPNPAFVALRNSEAHSGARRLMDEIFIEMGDSDGNFCEQFQTGGFHARLFELVCFKAFSESGFLTEHRKTPDFRIGRDGFECFVEATTSNNQDPKADISLKGLEKLNREEIVNKAENEFPIKIGSPLFSKISKRYWKDPDVGGRPFIIAVGAFHEAGSTLYTETTMAMYLFGLEEVFIETEEGTVLGVTDRESGYSFGGKSIPPGLFKQEGSENVSAVLFSNAFTVPKFVRMGIRLGYECSAMSVFRTGLCCGKMEEGNFPTKFQYDVRSPEAPEETWSQGSTLLINPNAKFPLPVELFDAFSIMEIRDGNLMLRPSGFHPVISTTVLVAASKKR